MLRAAVQVRLHGPESLKAIRDPAGRPVRLPRYAQGV